MNIARLTYLFAYDEASGQLIRAVRGGTKRAGSRAGRLKRDGYRYVTVDGKTLLEHRVIFAVVHGRWPEQVDHINMNRADNRLANLREATISQNNRNRPKQSNNTSGYKGVSFHKGTGKYHAKIMANKICRSLGYFSTVEAAAAAYAKASEELHGRFARQ